MAVSREKRKMGLVALHNVFSLFSPEEDVSAPTLLWKEGEQDGK